MTVPQQPRSGGDSDDAMRAIVGGFRSMLVEQLDRGSDSHHTRYKAPGTTVKSCNDNMVMYLMQTRGPDSIIPVRKRVVLSRHWAEIRDNRHTSLRSLQCSSIIIT